MREPHRPHRRATVVVAVFAALLALSACQASRHAEDMVYSETDDGPTITRGQAVYRFHGFVATDRLTGPQIGVLNKDRDHRVHRVKGYPDSEWLLEQLDTATAGQVHGLYRAESLTTVPAEFALDEGADPHVVRKYRN